jgi:aerobic-type carbon monoxide dehydrogenase small subunit (CoxS/CutS family)
MPEEKEKEQQKQTGISRRSFLKGVGTGAVATAVVPAVLVGTEKSAEAQMGDEMSRTKITLNINGEAREVEVEARTTVLSVLRDGFDTNGDRIDLTGAKPICERGECGGCTVQVDGKTAYSCIMLAMDAQEKQITTVEGLASDEGLHPVQEAFVQHDALMCGFCTPGFVVAAKSLLDENPSPSLEEIKVGLSGNTCRCGTYPFIFEAVKTASRKMGG